MPSPSRPSTLNFITSNPHKLSEVRAILSPDNGNSKTGITIQSATVDAPEIQGTIEEIARDKCTRAAEIVRGPVLTEDTALEFVSLKGLPGAYIKHFLASLGHTGLGNLLAAYEDKSAIAVCTFAFCAGPGEEPILFQGRTEGRIVSARGPPDFGWDPIFEVDGKTYAELEKGEKNLISHRYKALMKLKAWLAGGVVED